MGPRLALVTGASAGIGAAFARLYARRGHDVALTARRLDRLEALASQLEAEFGVRAFPMAADLADPDAAPQILDRLTQEGRRVDVLVNNAGYGLSGVYARTDWADQRVFLRVMVEAPAELAHRVLPGMLTRGYGRIINVASLAGLAPGGAGATLYAASKAFLVRFSESLHLETRGTGVQVTALCPGFTYSEFHDVTGSRAQVRRAVPAWLWQHADQVAAAGFAAVEANRALVVPGVANKAAAALARLTPDRLALALMAAYGPRVRAP